MTVSTPAAGWPQQPIILEINTWVWLDELSRRHGRHVDLGTLTAADWDEVLLPGVDAVWLMGVWERSPVGAAIARTEPGVRAELAAALADLTDDDIVGSPYCIRAYTVDAHLGGDDGLAAARASLTRRGVRLLVDYVPNHVARDHDWVTDPRGLVITGDEQDVSERPGEFFAVDDRVVALARDPYFPPWTDVAQLDAFSPALRAATVETLRRIADRADGVRCDMAMLMTTEVFARTWGERAGAPPDDEFWPAIIAAVRTSAPDFLFVAEAYWGMEWPLLQQGFDYCYDKTLYDRLVELRVDDVWDHLTADLAYQRRVVRFLENHDEPRAASRLPAAALEAAAAAVCTLPGAVLLYEGQAEGRRQRPPVQLGRRPDEPVDQRLRAFYRTLLGRIADSGMRTGRWQLHACDSRALAWSWHSDAQTVAVAVNLGDAPAAAPLHDTTVMLGPWEYRIDARSVGD
ncbi:MAG TPA: alpha-amylase family glycosyl hydrolase [Egibacteraceae bacterium]|nr:alpha-amylase family glycosyl hydrolase [Egibacteraceae bacterium]